jgi:hypothetical protein
LGVTPGGGGRAPTRAVVEFMARVTKFSLRSVGGCKSAMTVVSILVCWTRKFEA